MRLETHCPDGTDPQCYRTVFMDLPYTGLTAENIQPHWTGEGRNEKLESVTIYPPGDPKWLVENEPWLEPGQIEDIKNEGRFEIEEGDFPHHDCCAACGSSETYNAEGENITAL